MSTGTFPVVDGTRQFGLHFMLDAYDADTASLEDMHKVFCFLRDLPARIGMHPLSPPMVIEAAPTDSGFDPGGVTGFIIIAESHISIHTFAKKGFFTMDVYSCSNFEDQVGEIMDYARQTFGFKRHELQVVKRGTKYPMG